MFPFTIGIIKGKTSQILFLGHDMCSYELIFHPHIEKDHTIIFCFITQKNQFLKVEFETIEIAYLCPLQ